MSAKKQNAKNSNPINYDRPWDELDLEQIIAIDFGSFGFAAAFCNPSVPSYQKIVKDWSDSSRASAELNKNLAAVLINKNTKETVAIGYKAEELYKQAQEKKTDDEYMYFEHFKPYLYSKDHLEKNIEVPSADNKSSLPLADLITKSLEGVMDHSLNYINQLNKLAGIPELKTNKVFWVITCPAIWDEMSKEMMKLCAKRAGMIHSELGSEPIASTFHVLNSEGKDFQLKTHTKIMVLDCGGGTIDAACVEIISDKYDLSELHYGDGILAGGLNVDKKFDQLLNDILPKEIIEPVQNNQPAQWVRQRQEFVMAKFSLPAKLDNDERWNVPLCYGINHKLAKKRRKNNASYAKIKKDILAFKVEDYEQNENEELKESSVGAVAVGAIKLGRTNLRINQKGWLYLHEEVLLKIVAFVSKLFSNASLNGCNTIILVGGFANSKYLVNRLLKEFPTKKFLRPRQPHLAVVQGALYWVCQRRKLKKTRAKYSYGIAIDRRWNSNHDEISRQKNDPHIGLIVENAFAMLVARNDEREDGFTQKFEYTIPKNADHLEIFLYASEDSICRYVFKSDGKTLPTEAGKRVWMVKKFKLKLNKIYKEKRDFTLLLEYRQNGINLSFVDPNDNKTVIDVPIDLDTVKPNKRKIDEEQLN